MLFPNTCLCFLPPLYHSVSLACLSLLSITYLSAPPPPPNTSSSPSRLHVSPYNVCLIDSSRFSSLSASIFCKYFSLHAQYRDSVRSRSSQCGTHIRTLQQGTHKINGRVAYLPCTCVKDVPHIDNLPEQPSSSSLAWICLFNSQYSALKDFSSLRPSSPSNLKLHLKKVISFLRVLRNASTLVSAKMKQTG
jgi:hypothetical protein